MARDDDDSNSLAGNSPPGSPLPLSHLLLLPAHGEQPSADPESRQTTPSIDITPSPSREQTPPSESAVTTPVVLAAVVGSKRPAPDGDHSQFTLSERKHLMYNTAQIMRINDRVQTVVPGTSMWEILKLLWNEIESVSYTVLVSSVLPTYVSNHENPYLLKVVMLFLSLGPEMITELDAGRLLQPKNPARSSKLNILGLVAEIGALHKAAPVNVMLEVCAYIAYLCRCLLMLLKEKSEGNFWQIVDAKLLALRRDPPAEQSKTFLRALCEDQKTFGTVDDTEYEDANTIGSDAWIVDLAVQGKAIPSSATLLTGGQ
ncbi:hypothetical protein FOMPIDRAFT_86352 [Fomitopsis schrenkii]|uniref:Uncharacterized protein n=1 Tax=Fomitopsis schrenkii TaxID=2126942 RepID=S8DV27_FOMSC|nr:hypothetical protein FOMPIDRAFT_86352 [Fomitopsis schrenkii]